MSGSIYLSEHELEVINAGLDILEMDTESDETHKEVRELQDKLAKISKVYKDIMRGRGAWWY